MIRRVLRLGKRIGIAIAGSVVILAGVVMLVIPGPGLVTIVLGLGILSLEFERPRIWLQHLKARGVQVTDRYWRPRIWLQRLKARGVAIKDKFLHRQ
jgi:uncharacterized protein (TIGR02611 family)